MSADVSPFHGLVEFRPGFAPRPELAHVLFDFDGTLSLLRSGWPEVMVSLFAELLPRRAGESEAELRRQILDDVLVLNGKQTIYQMLRVADRIRERGGEPQDPLEYKHEYLRRLDERIRWRHARIAAGEAAPDEFLVRGARRALELLTAAGLKLHLASGTDEVFVRREAELLDVARYFGPRIYGAQDDYRKFSKRMAIERLLREEGIGGERLLAFGDGYVEIENTKEFGGLAVAVASDEETPGSGRCDPWKRERLAGVGADVVIPDYLDVEPLLERVLGRRVRA